MESRYFLRTTSWYVFILRRQEKNRLSGQFLPFLAFLSRPPRRVIDTTIGSLSKSRRRRQRERHQTKGLMDKTIAVHVRYKSLYISLPSCAKLQREMTKFCLVYRTWTITANSWSFHLELNAVVAYLA